MKTIFTLLLFVASFAVEAQQPAPPAAFPVAFSMSGDTLTVDSMRFVRFKPRNQRSMRMNICGTAFCITDQSGNTKPYTLLKLKVSMNINGVFVDGVTAGAQVDQRAMALLQGVKRGAECYFEAFQVTDANGKMINNLFHEAMCFRRLD
jgi:hypothetical protein